MPYITEERREIYDDAINKLAKVIKDSNACKGDLNYICYRFGLEYIEANVKSYQNISDAVDGVRGAAEELKRRVQDPYEDKKILQNGDIKAKLSTSTQ